jgi:hypothetical protein
MSEANKNDLNAGKKAILDQVREAIQNKEQIKEQVVQNLQTAGKIVELQAKSLIQQTKKSKFFNDNIVPLAGSELADKAMNVLNTTLKLKDTNLMKHVEKIRKDILETKVKKAKVAKTAEAAAATTTAADDQ